MVAESIAAPLAAAGQDKAVRDLLRLVAEFDYDAARERLADITRVLDTSR